MAAIRIGIGGWTYAPWRSTFYPPGLPHAEELAFASRQLTAIEINGTFYRHQSPASFAAWREATPADFVFAVKAHRAASQGKDPAAIAHFLGSGVLELGPKLGPILWQFSQARRYEPGSLEAFLSALPPALGGRTLRHAIEARHPSFASAEAVAQLRAAGVAQVIVDSDRQALRGDLTADFVYARLQRNSGAAPEGYPEDRLEAWVARFTAWAAGREAGDLPLSAAAAPSYPRDVFGFFIGGEKENAPRAAIGCLIRCRQAGAGMAS